MTRPALPSTPGPCPPADAAILKQELAAALRDAGLTRDLKTSHPHLFSPSSVFVSPENLEQMRAVVTAIETVVATPGYRARVLDAGDPVEIHDPGSAGVFFGYDFHFGPDGPRLIEINTNAGGALLALAQLRAQLHCCAPLRERLPGGWSAADIETAIVNMFREEWRMVHADRPLRHIAIVDSQPPGQFLYPEFELFRELFRRHGLEASIADPAALQINDARLELDGRPVDLVYNRLTDFGLNEPAQAVLRAAYLRGLAVITPHPRAHALYADKHNLAILSDPALLRGLGVAPETIGVLAGVAATRLVDRAQAEALWAQRKLLFFKPAAGYGGKAVYRGDKLTRRVWEEILAGDYVAQRLVPPAEQAVTHDATESTLKYDVRNFVYRGRVQLLAARLYQGQTTNFRTPGGGFAAVFVTAPPA